MEDTPPPPPTVRAISQCSVANAEESLKLILSSSDEGDDDMDNTVVEVPGIAHMELDVPPTRMKEINSQPSAESNNNQPSDYTSAAVLRQQLQIRDKLQAEMQVELARLTAQVCSLVKELSNTRKELELYRQGTQVVTNLQAQAASQQQPTSAPTVRRRRHRAGRREKERRALKQLHQQQQQQQNLRQQSQKQQQHGWSTVVKRRPAQQQQQQQQRSQPQQCSKQQLSQQQHQRSQQQRQKQLAVPRRKVKADMIEVAPANGKTWMDVYCKVRKGLEGTEVAQHVQMGTRTQLSYLRLPLSKSANSEDVLNVVQDIVGEDGKARIITEMGEVYLSHLDPMAEKEDVLTAIESKLGAKSLS
ncbi:uncharacterized protein LOC128298531 [Anopheles moucheti]|uniref:uncharacterized protein LOC128298531 n=1 Tax=Anopheles moucheti TaxID=186751 RepID=UPI0022EFF666|nr:uncharacterized protein LOC128298531 [Anopheles moucheti]